MKKSKKKPTTQKKDDKTGPLSTYVIAFTGAFTVCSKDELIEVCMQLGAECPKSLAKKCNLLMQGEYVEDRFNRKTSQDINTTNKSKDARERGIEIIAHDKIN